MVQSIMLAPSTTSKHNELTAKRKNMEMHFRGAQPEDLVFFLASRLRRGHGEGKKPGDPGKTTNKTLAVDKARGRVKLKSCSSLYNES